MRKRADSGVDVDEVLVHRAGVLADLHSLRGYDATQCASAESINDSDVVAASGDRQLLAAWRALGVNARLYTRNADDLAGIEHLIEIVAV